MLAHFIKVVTIVSFHIPHSYPIRTNGLTLSHDLSCISSILTLLLSRRTDATCLPPSSKGGQHTNKSLEVPNSWWSNYLKTSISCNFDSNHRRTQWHPHMHTPCDALRSIISQRPPCIVSRHSSASDSTFLSEWLYVHCTRTQCFALFSPPLDSHAINRMWLPS